jgi:hypothetical protein
LHGALPFVKRQTGKKSLSEYKMRSLDNQALVPSSGSGLKGFFENSASDAFMQQPPLQNFSQLTPVKGFAQIIVHSLLQTALAAALNGMGGHGNDRSM